VVDPVPWNSPLGASALAFLAAGGFQVFIGLATSVFVATGGRGRALFFTARSDTGAFGASPADMVGRQPGLDAYRRMFWTTLACFLLATGLLEVVVAWFGVRHGELWALVALTGVAVLMGTFWAVVVAWYVRLGARLTLADVPPFMWLPVVLHVVAVGVGWWGWRPSA
jgi:hypothetical protein